MDEQSIFLQILDQSTEQERTNKLDELCGKDDALRQRVQLLLQNQPTVFNESDRSIISRLAETRIFLRDVDEKGTEQEGAGQTLKRSSPEIPDLEPNSRYVVKGEIARGGMGAVLKCHDKELGRDLAVKVLLESNRDRPEIIQRFVEEAQIGGQLQHPGIAPVYEFGEFVDKRPFISMKLVKGTTLSQLLAARPNPNSELGRFLGIFEQICQTMAYVHTRGVIHRDLKPANIMVGAFGEVQVMDWGLAKVMNAGGTTEQDNEDKPAEDVSVIRTLRSTGSDTPEGFGSKTRMGSVLGTPAYMPPEQALGEVDQLDERADVFALGAILCQILTGKPPYPEGNSDEIHRHAIRGRLKVGLERLERCDADRDLVQLASQCIEVEPADRPRDAGDLAKRVTNYLGSVQTKLRDAEIESATQSARIEEERKRKRLSYVLAAIVVGFVVTGAIAWQQVLKSQATLRAEADDRQRTQQSEGMVNLLASADMAQLQGILQSIKPLRSMIEPELARRHAKSDDGSNEKLRLSIALLPNEPQHTTYLLTQLPKLSLQEFSVVRDALKSADQTLSAKSIETLWEVAIDMERSPAERFQTGCALATYAPDDERWNDLAEHTVQCLTIDDATVPSLHLSERIDQLQPVAAILQPKLQELLTNANVSDFARQRSASCTARLLLEKPEGLVDTILLCRKQTEFAPLLTSLAAHTPAALAHFDDALLQSKLQTAPDDQFLSEHHRLAIAAVTLAHFRQIDSLINLLEQPSSNPSMHNLLKHYAAEIPVDSSAILITLTEPALPTEMVRQLVDVLARRGPQGLEPAERTAITDALKRLADNNVNPGVRQSALSALAAFDINLPIDPIPVAQTSEKIAARIMELGSRISAHEAELKTILDDQPARRQKWEQELAERPATDFDVNDKSLLLSLSLDGPNDFDLITQLDDTDPLDDQLRSATKVGSMRNRCIEFNGQPPINFGDAVTFNKDKPCSFGAWVYVDPNNKQQWSAVISRFDTQNNHRGVDLWLDGDKIGAHFVHREPDNYIKVVTKHDVPREYWHHMFITYDGSSTAKGVKIYYDGELMESDAVADSLDGEIETSVPLILGSRGGGEFSFRGWVEDVRVYGRELSDAEVNSIYLSAIHLVLNLPSSLKIERRVPLARAFRDRSALNLETELKRLRKDLANDTWSRRRRWFVDQQGHSFTVLPTIYTNSESESIGYDFAVSAHEVTVEQFRHFRATTSFDDDVATSERCPAHNLTWFEIAEYCNWLSEQAGIPKDQWCFVPNEEAQYEFGMTLKPNYRELSGYRMPTRAEWRSACSGQAVTTFSFAGSAELINDFGWYAGNANGATHPVGSLAPNPYGLFDMHGNVGEWMIDLDNLTQTGQINDNAYGYVYGGDIESDIDAVTTDANVRASPNERSLLNGFRIARSILSQKND